MSTPLVKINEDLIINLFQTTRIKRDCSGNVFIHTVDGACETLSSEEGERFMAYAREASDNVPWPTPAADANPSEARDFGAILDDPNPLPAEPPTING